MTRPASPAPPRARWLAAEVGGGDDDGNAAEDRAHLAKRCFARCEVEAPWVPAWHIVFHGCAASAGLAEGVSPRLLL